MYLVLWIEEVLILRTDKKILSGIMTLEFPQNLIQTQPRNSIYLRITIIVFVGLNNP